VGRPPHGGPTAAQARQGWADRSTGPRCAGQPPGVALLYTQQAIGKAAKGASAGQPPGVGRPQHRPPLRRPRRAGPRTGQPPGVGRPQHRPPLRRPPARGGPTIHVRGRPAAQQATATGHRPAGHRPAGHPQGVALLYTTAPAAVYSRATPCGWPATVVCRAASVWPAVWGMACRGGLLCGGYMTCRAVACGERMTCRVGYGLPRWSAVQRAYDLPCGVWPVAVACCAASVWPAGRGITCRAVACDGHMACGERMTCRAAGVWPVAVACRGGLPCGGRRV